MIQKITKFLLFTGFLIPSLYSTAQQISDAPDKRFGFIGGVNVSNMNFNRGFPRPATPVASSWKSGITVGFLLDIALAKKLFLQPEYYFTQRNGEDKSNETEYSADYLSFPLLLKYKVSSRFSVLAGPQAELLIRARDNSHGVDRNITHDMEERSIGATAGFDFEFYRYLILSARYMRGLNHIGIGQRENVKEFKYDVANLMVGIRF